MHRLRPATQGSFREPLRPITDLAHSRTTGSCHLPLLLDNLARSLSRLASRPTFCCSQVAGCVELRGWKQKGNMSTRKWVENQV